MPSTLESIAYRAAQRLLVSWYFGQKWLSARLTDAVPAPPELKERMPDRAHILADLRALLDQDWRNIEQGLYRLPESVIADPLAMLRKAGRYFADLRRVDARRRADASDEIFRSTPPGRYPRYYLQNFHYQTDGWLSRRSAELYDHQVEVLFGGGADAMRRQALVPLGRVLAERGVRNAALLDLACGTGRFLREVKSNYPKLAVTALRGGELAAGDRVENAPDALECVLALHDRHRDRHLHWRHQRVQPRPGSGRPGHQQLSR